MEAITQMEKLKMHLKSLQIKKSLTNENNELDVCINDVWNLIKRTPEGRKPEVYVRYGNLYVKIHKNDVIAKNALQSFNYFELEPISDSDNIIGNKPSSFSDDDERNFYNPLLMTASQLFN